MTTIILMLLAVDVLQKVGMAAAVLAFMAFGTALVAILCTTDHSNREEDNKKLFSVAKRALKWALISGAVYVAIPSTDTMKLGVALYAAGEVAETVASIEGVSDVPKNAVAALNKALEQFVGEADE